MKRDTKGYDKWFAEFSNFLKEGVISDNENREQLMRLMRYHCTLSAAGDTLTLEEYLK